MIDNLETGDLKVMTVTWNTNLNLVLDKNIFDQLFQKNNIDHDIFIFCT